MGEVLAIVYTFQIRSIIEFIEEGRDEQVVGHAIKLIMYFSVPAILSTIIKNFYSFHTYKLAIKMRKTLIAALYEKIGKLSAKSLIKTNHGRIVQIISSEIFGVEKGLTVAPVVFSAPVINLAAYIFIGISLGWYFAISTFVLWLILFIV